MPRAENINHRILPWARETAGLSLEEAARRIGLTTSARASAEEKLLALEEGRKKPTRQQLLKIASTYRRPLTAFYASDPPKAAERGEDFRTFAAPVSREDAALLDALLRDIRARQDMVRAILEDDDDARRLAFVGSLRVTEPIPAAAETIRRSLGIAGDLPRPCGQNGAEEVFGVLRERVEALGVFVMLVGNLGSHHTTMSERIFRGFAIADDLAPFIVINDQDAKAARSFTLMHELVHVFVGSSGVSGAPSTVMPDTPLARVERFCNDVAGEFLLPEASIGPVADDMSEAIADLASARGVSEAMVAYRFWRTNRISEETYRELAAMYAARWQQHRQRRREAARETEGGPSYYVVRKHRLGNALLGLVGRSLRANELTHTKAAKVLGVKPSSVEPLVRGLPMIDGPHAPDRR
ncbi:MAG: ImmA/IrrE family metallo-endopeptidase [Alphaproteobacteria bacterium]|jgi:Zn-dependent peptidase ImmA (M78 family)/transcriptional regulator with XRE-family HTH domain|nr:ImmA/IrrE family metallo-endopeptidase [Alphaproteobacteria bacterium]